MDDDYTADDRFPGDRIDDARPTPAALFAMWVERDLAYVAHPLTGPQRIIVDRFRAAELKEARRA